MNVQTLNRFVYRFFNYDHIIKERRMKTENKIIIRLVAIHAVLLLGVIVLLAIRGSRKDEIHCISRQEWLQQWVRPTMGTELRGHSIQLIQEYCLYDIAKYPSTRAVAQVLFNIVMTISFGAYLKYY